MGDLTLTIAKFAGSLGRSGVSVTDYSVADIRQLQRALKNIEPGLRTQFVRDVKEVAKPIQTRVKSTIPAVAPMRGMTGKGRMSSWNASVDGKGRTHVARDVKIQFRTQSSGRSMTTSLVRVAVLSPVIVMADMAGKSNRSVNAGYKGSGVTREYSWKGRTRRHKLAGQGKQMMANLGGGASRYAWPAAQSAIPAAGKAIQNIINKYADLVNRRGI